jgi:hypothetical protein
MIRNCEIKLRLTKTELQNLDKKSAATGMSREGYMRTVLGGYAPVCVPPMDFFNLVNELRAIGNSMDQIAQRAHTLRFIDVQQYEENTMKVLETCDYIFSLHLPVKVGDMYNYIKKQGGS